MGVKNLAFCAVEIDHANWVTGRSNNMEKDRTPKLTVWQRRDLVAAQNLQPSEAVSKEDTDEQDADDAAPTRGFTFTPSAMSKIAYSLAREFLSYQPTTILIERQRFRSGGSAAIQEWTVKVNLLESMIWAALETMRHHTSSKQQFPDVYEVDPRRVGLFCLGQPVDEPLGPSDMSMLRERQNQEIPHPDQEKKRSFEKKDKVALVQRWLRSSEISHTPELHDLCSAFVSRGSRKNALSNSRTAEKPQKKKKKNDVVEDLYLQNSLENTGHCSDPATQKISEKSEAAKVLSGKLDDLADCVVQAITFALWEENKKQVGRTRLPESVEVR